MRRALPISESTCRRSSILPTAPSTASCEHFTQGSCLDREKRRKLVFHLFHNMTFRPITTPEA